MQIEWIIAALRARCPTLSGRVAGAAQFKMLPESAALAVPCAYVIPLDDNPQDAKSDNGIRQELTDSFAVIVALSNTVDERGQAAAIGVHAMRRELWRAVLGWRPVDTPAGDTSTSEYGGIRYEGGQALGLDRARLWYQFEFGAPMEIGPEDGYQETELGNLPGFDGFTIQIDVSSPSDPNKADPASGMDGRIEAGATITGMAT